MSNQEQTQSASATDTDNFTLDLVAKEWMAKKIAEEIERLKKQGAKAVPLTVKNTSVVLDEDTDTVINRIELNTSFDFSRIEQIMLSPPQLYPHNANLQFVFVLCFTCLPHPLIIPYLYAPKLVGKNLLPRADGLVENTLKRWAFINDKMERADHVIHEFQDVTA
ncbi:hypothetical protein SJAG_02327 [Schizosaccharomyces japonicus yFS275]|uniref:Uncharacterized protein n=1 Tax=Schizosaccharomyces japonicus (strain yFS275 / FY16936) TaxID=402676 RepID=B6K261_SCHJY|nr:hypothetical protein SJAG_02327 [Schizosaccharomyces japonicus yFS275]EEB07242.1 hypothetical protein SJAG_02327 [Schizosaccharomyces japonicus yFS275]